MKRANLMSKKVAKILHENLHLICHSDSKERKFKSIGPMYDTNQTTLLYYPRQIINYVYP